jgi:hypothetical protein
MATNIQSHTELKSYLEERLHAHYPAANNQEIAHAVEVAMGRWGYALHHENDQRGQQDQRSQNARQDQYSQQDQQGQQDQHARQNQQGQQDQHSQNDQRGQQNRDNNQHSAAHQSIASVRDAAISAAQNISDSSLRMAAVACAWASYAATYAQADQLNQQRAARN